MIKIGGKMFDNSKSFDLRVFLMGGTKDSINIIKFLKENYNSVFILTTTTTKYGAKIAKEAGSDEVIAKPLLKKEILKILNTYFDKKDFDVFIDATHPFASHVTSTAIEVSKIVNIPYIRFERPNIDYSNYNNIYLLDSFEEAGKLITTKFKNKNILHLAGVNTIESLLNWKGDNISYENGDMDIDIENLYVRVLPVKSSIKKCNSLGISGERIIAMQGTFSKEFNMELMKEIGANVIITKESGDTGGVPSKIAAANELEIPVILISRPKINNLKEKNIVNDFDHLKRKLKLLE